MQTSQKIKIFDQLKTDIVAELGQAQSQLVFLNFNFWSIFILNVFVFEEILLTFCFLCFELRKGKESNFENPHG